MSSRRLIIHVWEELLVLRDGVCNLQARGESHCLLYWYARGARARGSLLSSANLPKCPLLIVYALK